MAEFSAIVAIQVDEAGRPTNLEAFQAGDTLASSVLTQGVKDVVTAVEDTSAVWDAGGDPQIATYVRSASGDIESVSGSVASVVDGSGHWLSGYNYSLSAWETVSSTSSTWTGGGASAPGYEGWQDTFEIERDTSSVRGRVVNYITNGSGSIGNTSSFASDSSANLINASSVFRGFSGSVETSTTTLDTSVGALNVWSGSVETSTTTLDTSVGALNVWSGSVDTSVGDIGGPSASVGLGPSAAGFATWNTIYGDRDNIISVSGSVDASNTAWLNGATPTLTNPLRGDDLTLCSTANDLILSSVAGSYIHLKQNLHMSGNNINGVLNIKSETGGNLIISGTNTYLLGTTSINIGPHTGNFSSLLPIMYDLAAASGIASAIFVGNTEEPTSSITISGCGADTLPPVQTDGMILALDVTAGRLKWTKQAFQYDPAEGTISFGEGVGADTVVAMGGGDIVARNIDAATTLSAADTCVTQLEGPVILTSSMDISGSINGMPYPPPYAHIRMNATGVNSDDQYNFASGCGNMYTTSSNSSHFNWNDTDKELDVSAAGEYEVNLTAAAQTDTTNNQVTCRVKLDGVIQTAITYRINTATDPHPISISWIGPVTSGQSITVTIDGTENTQLMLGSAITVKRVS